jgi:DNA-binding response OmpR family regulator
MASRLVVVEDDVQMAASLASLLRAEGYQAQAVGSASELLELARTDPPDLVLLDVNLPDLGGVEACRRLRSFWFGPLIMVTGRRGEADRILGLDAGADDYVLKPFLPNELLARIRAALRRTRSLAIAGSPLGTFVVDGLVIDCEAHTVTVNGCPVDLSAREFGLLRLLGERPGRALSRRQLIDELWDASVPGDEHSLDVYMSMLRRKLRAASPTWEYIRTIRGVGYKLQPPPTEQA